MTDNQQGVELDPWTDLGLHCVGYSSKIDSDMIVVLRGIRAKRFCTDIAQENHLSAEYVELLQSILASADIVEYGTSPRGCFFMDDKRADEYIKMWETYYKNKWGVEPCNREGEG